MQTIWPTSKKNVDPAETNIHVVGSISIACAASCMHNSFILVHDMFSCFVHTHQLTDFNFARPIAQMTDLKYGATSSVGAVIMH